MATVKILQDYRPAILQGLIATAGAAALTWEVLWQIRAALALGVSALGTALTLAVTMGGMSIGSLTAGYILRARLLRRPLRIYGVMEIIIGLSGLGLGFAFHVVSDLDKTVYAIAPSAAPIIHILSIAGFLGLPAFCMGATLPLFGLLAQQYRSSIATLYSMNTLGAAGGVLLAAFFLIPQFGVTASGWIAAAANFAVGLCVFFLPLGDRLPEANAPSPPEQKPPTPIMTSYAVAVVTGFSAFALEIAWFRALTAIYQSTTEAFAVILATVLIALSLGARLAPYFKRRGQPLGIILVAAGIFTFIATPLVTSLDLIEIGQAMPIFLIINRMILTFYVIGLPMAVLGIALPWILDEQTSPRLWGKIYALNTLAAIAGSIGAAWFLLPMFGHVATAWLAGALILITGVALAPRRRLLYGGLGAGMLMLTLLGQQGIERLRNERTVFEGSKLKRILEHYEGPEATVSAVEYENGGRALIVDGFLTAAQIDDNKTWRTHYMAWMGHLPMLLHPHPHDALVICFGTGQTANAVRNENPQTLDIVDINPRVFKLSKNFTANQNVLRDPRVTPIVMDGRAYMRRAVKNYDVITLEPMPPSFAGVNALYSREFYQLAHERLRPGGLIAQWLPFHLVSASDGAAIARTLQSVFPNALLWIDPLAQHGILIGIKGDNNFSGSPFPGFTRPGKGRDLSEGETHQALRFNAEQLRRYGEHGVIITDDNQHLAYGKAVNSIYFHERQMIENFLLLQTIDNHNP